jgi:hypothetical protein
MLTVPEGTLADALLRVPLNWMICGTVDAAAALFCCAVTRLASAANTRSAATAIRPQEVVKTCRDWCRINPPKKTQLDAGAKSPLNSKESTPGKHTLQGNSMEASASG